MCDAAHRGDHRRGTLLLAGDLTEEQLAAAPALASADAIRRCVGCMRFVVDAGLCTSAFCSNVHCSRPIGCSVPWRRRVLRSLIDFVPVSSGRTGMSDDEFVTMASRGQQVDETHEVILGDIHE